jgi:hypothetical protein
MFTNLIEARKDTCGDLYNCCNCGGNGDDNGGSCGCAYCFACHACEACLSDDENAVCELLGDPA